MSYGCLFQPVEFIHATHVRHVHDEVIRVFVLLWQAQPIEGDCRRRGERVVRLAQPIRACDRHTAHLGVHPGGEADQISELCAHGKSWDVSKRVHDGERGAGVVDDLVGKEARKVGVELTACGLCVCRNPFEEEDERVQGLKVCQ